MSAIGNALSTYQSIAQDKTAHDTSTSGQTAAPADPLGSESTFLTLLVSQLQNQDPLNPTDSTQFVSQLTSFSQLEQLINIDQNTTPVTATTPSASSSTANAVTPGPTSLIQENP